MLFCMTIAVVKAQDTTTAAKDSGAFFHADKVVGAIVLNERAVPDTTVQRLRNDEAFWYANTSIKKKGDSEPHQYSFLQWLFRQAWFYNFLWALITVSFIAVIIVFLMKSNVQLFHKRATPLAGIETGAQENIFSIHYEEALNKALLQNDFRLAVRLHYLQTLALLSGKNIIHYKDDFTNSDYLLQLRQTSHYTAFKKLTRHFEYAWYGEFTITPTAFKTIEADFAIFKSSMGV